jgi:hypothetical protein
LQGVLAVAGGRPSRFCSHHLIMPPAVVDGWRASESCIHCGSDAFQLGWGSQTFIQCDCCADLGTHVGCHEKDRGEVLQQEEVDSPNFQWFCSKVRASIFYPSPTLDSDGRCRLRVCGWHYTCRWPGGSASMPLPVALAPSPSASGPGTCKEHAPTTPQPISC